MTYMQLFAGLVIWAIFIWAIIAVAAAIIGVFGWIIGIILILLLVRQL